MDMGFSIKSVHACYELTITHAIVVYISTPCIQGPAQVPYLQQRQCFHLREWDALLPDWGGREESPMANSVAHSQT